MKFPQLLLAMKLAVVLLIAGLLQVNAAGFAQKITISRENVSLKQVLTEIQQQTGYHFLYTDEMLEEASPVDVKLDNASLEEALRQCFAGQPLTYTIRKNTVVVKRLNRLLTSHTPEAALPQTDTLRGTVTDTTGAPLPGVSVVVKNKAGWGTSTGVNGEYALEVPGDAVLVFSYLGFRTQEVPVNGRSVLNVTLREEGTLLDELVVVGYGTQRRRDITGSVEQINAEQIVRRPATSTSQALQGLAPGITVTQQTGQPGNDRGTIRIRGVGTLGDTDPLVLVDGVATDINGVDPNDIESMSVLKDASAAAIYGSRAANGVVLITTKRGEAGKLAVNYRGYGGVQVPADLPEFLGGLDFMTYLNEANLNEGKNPPYSEQFIQEWLAGYQTDPDHYPNTDWQEAVMRSSAPQQQHYIGINGGSDKVKFLGSLAYLDQQGLVANMDYDRVTLRMNTDVAVSEKLDFGFDFSGRYSKQDAPSTNAQQIFYQMNRIPPIFADKHSDGSWGVGWNGNNPRAMAEDGGVNAQNWSEGLLNLKANYRPVAGLELNVLASPKFNYGYHRDFSKSIEIFDFDSKALLYALPARSESEVNSSKSLEMYLRGLATYTRSFADHGFKVLLGYDQTSYRNDQVRGFRDTYPLPDFQEIDAGSLDNQQAGGTAWEWSLRSYFGRLNYDYKGKYLIEANVRYDGASRFAGGRKWGLFPSFSAGWRISDEAFMSEVSFIDDLKIRVAWGQLGNQNIGTYPFVTTVDLGQSYSFGNGPADGAGVVELADPTITWETTEMTNFGIDLSFWNYRFEVAAEYYIRNTHDILLDIQVPWLLGGDGTIFRNAGKVRNTGWDLSITHRNRINDFNYSVGLVLSDVKNEITDLMGSGPYIDAHQIRQVGYPIDALFGYEAMGLFRDQEEVDNHASQIGVVGPGDIRYKDQNEDGVINAADRVIMGNPFPRYTYSLRLGADYKGFDLSLFFQGVGKRDGYMTNEGARAFHNGGKIQRWHLDRWTPENPDPNAPYPRFTFAYPNNGQHSSFWVRDASYLRLKNLTLGYTLPASVLNNKFINSLRIFFSGDNVFTLDNFYPGQDPETSTSLPDPTQNFATGNFHPFVSVYTLGVDVSF